MILLFCFQDDAITYVKEQRASQRARPKVYDSLGYSYIYRKTYAGKCTF